MNKLESVKLMTSPSEYINNILANNITSNVIKTINLQEYKTVNS